MDEHPESTASADMASRIEKTLVEREQERLKEAPVNIEVIDSERATREPSYSGYLMLLLGVLVGALIGVALYSFLPDPASTTVVDLHKVEGLRGIEEADRLLALGQFDPARKAYLNLIAQGADSPRPYNNLATLYAAEGDFDQAQRLLKQALETDKAYLTVYNNVGMVYAAMARDSYGKALQLEDETKPVRLQTLGLPQTVPLVAQELTIPPEDKVVVIEPVAPVENIEVGKSPQISVVATKEMSHLTGSGADVKPPAAIAGGKALLADVVPSKVTLSVAAESATSQDSAISDSSAHVSPQQFLKKWTEAWSSKDIETYLQSYATEYVSKGSSSHSDWQEKRRKRVTAPKFIEVELDAIKLVSETKENTKVQAIQTYRSDRYQDRTRKSFVLRRSGQTWVIIEERSLGRVL